MGRCRFIVGTDDPDHVPDSTPSCTVEFASARMPSYLNPDKELMRMPVP